MARRHRAHRTGHDERVTLLNCRARPVRACEHQNGALLVRRRGGREPGGQRGAREISTGLRAVHLGRVGLAMGDIFGGNQVQSALYAVGLVVRPRRKILGIGPDSLLVVVAYVIRLACLVRIT